MSWITSVSTKTKSNEPEATGEGISVADISTAAQSPEGVGMNPSSRGTGVGFASPTEEVLFNLTPVNTFGGGLVWGP